MTGRIRIADHDVRYVAIRNSQGRGVSRLSAFFYAFVQASLTLLLGGLVLIPTVVAGEVWRPRNPSDWCTTSAGAEDGCAEVTADLISTPHRCRNAIQFTPIYYGELFTNAKGGLSAKDATRYQALLDLNVEFDLSVLESGPPGRIFLLAQNTHGRGITTDFVGDSQVISNIDSGSNIMRVNEYWWEFDLLQESVTVRLGKQDLNTEFWFLSSAEDFVHSAFGLTPALALPTYPDPTMGAVVLAQLTDSCELKFGIWDALGFGGSWGISGNSTVLTVGELEWKYELGPRKLPGTFAFGAGHITDAEVDGQTLGSTHGFLFQLEQLIWKEATACSDQPQGLGIFFTYVPRFFSGQVKLTSLGNNFVGGLVYRGLIPGRDDDMVGAGVAWAELFQGGTNEETVVEWFYKARVSEHLSIQPDLQYVSSPSGIYQDAVVVGVRFQLDF